jgi:hypothetical protein
VSDWLDEETDEPLLAVHRTTTRSSSGAGTACVWSACCLPAIRSTEPEQSPGRLRRRLRGRYA